ncbi:MAG TPA: tetratricopeptide repeat protein [Actinomycetota bacterium]
MEPDAGAEQRYRDGMTAFRQGDQGLAASAFEESLRSARASGDERTVILAMMGLARVDLRRGDLTAVRRRAEEALALAERLDPAARQHPLHLLATADRVGGRYDEAVERYRESLELNRGLGNERWVTMETMNLAAAERGLGRLDDAETHLREALSSALEGEGQDLITFCVLGFAGIAAERGEAERAGTLVGAIDAWLEEETQILDPDDAPDFERAVERGRAAGPDEFERGRSAGRSMSISQAADVALAGRSR